MKISNKLLMNDKAVSAVIGVILMVTITVILAAVIATFLFQMPAEVKRPYNIAVVGYRSGPTITLAYNGGADADQLVSLTVDAYAALDGALLTISPGNSLGTNIGSIVTFSDTIIGNNKTHIIVKALFFDGTSQVVLNIFI